MLSSINISHVFVFDQQKALDFYVGTLGLEVSNDMDLGFMRWLTVRVPGDPTRDILLELPGPPGMDPKAADATRELISKGASGFAVGFTTDDVKKTFDTLKAKGVDITQELTEQLCKTFVTPLEREDIQALAAALYKIPKTVEKIGERVLICPEDLHGRDFRRQVELLDQAAETVLAMVKQLRKGTDTATAREMNAKLQSIEGDADKLELDLLRDLYQGDYKTKQVIFLRDLFELIEKVIDRCRDAGNIILQVALKYS